MQNQPDTPGEAGHAGPQAELSAAAPEDAFLDCMREGARRHAAGQLPHALIAFEEALALQPQNLQAVSACATLMTALDRPAAAYRILMTVELLLLQDADGAANLAIAAETCGHMDKALEAYQHALALNPQHLRTLNNLAVLASTRSQWDIAIDHARRCLSLDPLHAPYVANLTDFLCGARRYDEALEVIDAGLVRFPGDLDLLVRRMACLAFAGRFDASSAALQALDVRGRAFVTAFLSRATEGPEIDHQPRAAPDTPQDARKLYTDQAFEALRACDWRGNEQLTGILRQWLAQARATGAGRDWRDAQFYGLMLDFRENELADLRRLSIATLKASVATSLPAFAARRLPSVRKDDRLHIGISTRSLGDPRHAHAFGRQLALHDSKRFAIHVYSPTRKPEAWQTETLRSHAASVVEIAHMTDAEAAARMRLDQLDVWVDQTFNTAWCRPEIPAMRVAPVQIHQLTWHRHHAPGLCDYNLSDTFVHPDGLDLAPCGPIVRLPYSCWLATHDEAADPGFATRQEAGLPDDRLLLCALVPSVMLDPQTFGCWMKLLRSLPDAVLWLPSYDQTTVGNLRREAQAAGVNASRLVFAGPTTRSQTLACLKHADLFLDTFRFNGNTLLADALRMGVPAISCAGNSMASCLGGSILRAAGLPEGVLPTQAAYEAEAIRLGRNPEALQRMRQQLHAALPDAPLFDLASRVREWETAWTLMAVRWRQGMPPAGFDVPSAGRPSGAAEGLLSNR